MKEEHVNHFCSNDNNVTNKRTMEEKEEKEKRETNEIKPILDSSKIKIMIPEIIKEFESNNHSQLIFIEMCQIPSLIDNVLKKYNVMMKNMKTIIEKEAGNSNIDLKNKCCFVKERDFVFSFFHEYEKLSVWKDDGEIQFIDKNYQHIIDIIINQNVVFPQSDQNHFLRLINSLINHNY